MSTIQNKLLGVALSAAILGGAVALADPSGVPLRQAATSLVAGPEGAAVVALVDGDHRAAPSRPVQAAQAPSSFAAQSALLHSTVAPRDH